MSSSSSHVVISKSPDVFCSVHSRWIVRLLKTACVIESCTIWSSRIAHVSGMSLSDLFCGPGDQTVATSLNSYIFFVIMENSCEFHICKTTNCCYYVKFAGIFHDIFVFLFVFVYVSVLVFMFLFVFMSSWNFERKKFKRYSLFFFHLCFLFFWIYFASYTGWSNTNFGGNICISNNMVFSIILYFLYDIRRKLSFHRNFLIFNCRI